MRPIKEIQEATHFRKVAKKELIEQGLLTDDEDENESSGEDSSEIPRDLVWVPVCSDSNSDDYDPAVFKSLAKDIFEIDLPQISEKKIFVRKANQRDFKKSINNCKPTVNTVFLELYARFL